MIAAWAAFLCKTPSGFAVIIGASVTWRLMRTDLPDNTLLEYPIRVGQVLWQYRFAKSGPFMRGCYAVCE